MEKIHYEGGLQLSSACTTRALGPALVSAASTLGLFMAAFWESSFFDFYDFFEGGIELWQGWKGKIRKTLFFFLALPLAVLESLHGFFLMEVLRRRVQISKLYQQEGDTVAIILLCPIIIAVPFVPGQSLAHICAQETNISSLETPPLEFPTRRSTEDGVMPDNVFMLSLDSATEKSWKERVVLLELKLVPTYKHLSVLRSRGMSRTIVTLLQAMGYMVGVGQRQVGHVAISPVEAFVGLYCVQMTVQLLLELFSGSTVCYSYPLLLRLQSHHFFDFNDHLRRSSDSSALRSRTKSLSYLAKFSAMLLQAALQLYYGFSVCRHCPLCFVSSVLISLFSCLLLVPLTATAFKPKLFEKHSWTEIATVVLIVLFSLSSSVLSVLATILDWASFDARPENNWFAWILPHVPSSCST